MIPLKCVITLLVIPLTLGSCQQWQDPHSMDSNVKRNILRSEIRRSLDEKVCEKTICLSDQYLRRIVRLILANTPFSEKSRSLVGHLTIQLSQKDHDFLEKFSQNELDGDSVFSEVSSIFEMAIKKSWTDNVLNYVSWARDEAYYTIFNRENFYFIMTVLIIGLPVLYILYLLLRGNLTWVHFIFLVIALLLYEFTVTYIRLNKQEEINNLVLLKSHGSVPPECDPQKMSWWKYFKTKVDEKFNGNPCKKYYEATHINTVYVVTPIKVIKTMFKEGLVDPAGDVGEAIGRFMGSIFTSLPWGLNIVLFPIVLITLCIFSIISLIFFTKTPIRLRMFPWIDINLGQNPNVPRIEHQPIPRIENVIRIVNEPVPRIENLLIVNEPAPRIENEPAPQVVYNTEKRALIEEISHDSFKEEENSDEQLKEGICNTTEEQSFSKSSSSKTLVNSDISCDSEKNEDFEKESKVLS